MRTRQPIRLSVAGVLVLLTTSLFAQPLGVVNGRVLAETEGKPVVGAVVGIYAEGWSRETTTDQNGRFGIVGVPYRKLYRVEVRTSEGVASGGLGAVYPDAPTTLEIRIYGGMAGGPCADLRAVRQESGSTFRVPFRVAGFPVVCW